MPTHGWFAHAADSPEPAVRTAEERFELADLRRYAGLRLRRFVAAARAAERVSFRSLIAAHLGWSPADLPVVAERWPAYEHVNVQVGLDDLVGEQPDFGLRPGNVTRVSLPSGPKGETRECLQAALVLVTDGEGGLAVLLMADPDEGGSVVLQRACIAARSRRD